MKAVLAVVWALLAAVLGWRAVTAKAPEIERDVRSRTEAVVAQILPGAGVDVDGRFVHLNGEAPDDATLQKTIHAARGVYGALGPWKGLWVAKAVAAVAPSVNAVKTAGALVLSGAVSSDAAKASVGDAAKAAFSGAIDNRLVVSAAASTTDLPGLADAFAALATLDSGSAVVTPEQVLLAGATGDKAVAEAVTALGKKSGWSVNVAGPAGDLSAPRVAELEAALAKARTDAETAAARAAAAVAEVDALKARIADLEKLAAGGSDAANKLLADLEAAKAALADAEAKRAAAENAATQCAARAEAAEKAAADAKTALDAANRRIGELEAALAAKPAEPGNPAEPAAPALTADACNAMMLKSLAGASITFGTNSAVVTPQGAEVLDAIARDAIACATGGNLKVEIGGHTDSRGDDAANLRLSQRRADAVRDALVLRNVPGDAVTAVGYGETKPIEDNETETGRQANRRIEFIWAAR